MGTRLSHWCRGCGHHIDTHAPNRCNGLTTVDVVEQSSGYGEKAAHRQGASCT